DTWWRLVDTQHELDKVLLCTPTHQVGQLDPRVDELRQIGLGEPLLHRVDPLELALPGRRTGFGKLVRVLAACPLVEPVGLLTTAVGCGSPEGTGDPLDRHVKIGRA